MPFQGGRQDFENSYFQPTFVPPIASFRRPRDQKEAQQLYNHARTYAFMLDKTPGLGGISSEAVLGFVLPYFGDFGGLVLSLYFIALSYCFGISQTTLLWMVFNVAVDLLIGFIPFVGSFLDYAWKSNLRNLDLLEAWLDSVEGRHYQVNCVGSREFDAQPRR